MMSENSVTISFLGDISFNDKYKDLYKENVKPFNGVSKFLSASDFVAGNLECIAQGNDGENLLKKPRLKTDVETLNYLKDLNIDLVSLAHNHAYDNLLSGFLKTTDFLDSNNINYLGASTSKEQASAPYIITLNRIKFCFLNYVTRDTNCNLPDDAEVYLNWFDKEKIIEDINKYRDKVDYVIALFHWGGNMEGSLYPHFDQPEIARDIIDSGADLIVGNHSHTLQPYDIYNNKYMFYSLGNFCFSDINSDGRVIELKRGNYTESVILNVTFQKESYSVKLLPIENKEHFIHKKQDILKRYHRRLIYFNYIKKVKLLWGMCYLKYRYYDPIKFYFIGNDRNFIDRLRMLNWDKIVRFINR